MPATHDRTGIVRRLAKKYRQPLARARQTLRRNQCEPENPPSYISDVMLFAKWAYRVGKGWYGFDVGSIPDVWLKMIDEFLLWVETVCPDFVIKQVKFKGPGLRMYLGTKTTFVIPDENIRAEIEQLQKLLTYPPMPAPVRVTRKQREPKAQTIKPEPLQS